MRPRFQLAAAYKVFIWFGKILETDTNPESDFKLYIMATDLSDAYRQADALPIPPAIKQRIRVEDPDVFAAPFAEFNVYDHGQKKSFSVLNAQRLGTAGRKYATLTH